ncbi:MAG: hypothetical protein BZ136_08460 [Methanosphaera sp. rholeuAM74]|nr:MAG: hypothetical protein BZ136_08460 [Methanosphaera sp. rholeuAM74]
MNRFWDITILPLLTKIKAKHIVEIGSDKGRNTRDILKFCKKNNAKLTSIDPKPNFDVNKLKKQYGDSFEFYEDLSLNVLPLVDTADVILIDGDHNWYTVFNELKAIEKNYEKTNKYPLVLFHDVCWPYGRRDLYYNPETIPKEYLLPYEEKGIIPNQSELSPDKGINSTGLKNAVYEGGEHNGVLTAIEDYIKESKLDLMFYSIPAYYGLGILFLKNKKLKKIIRSVIDYRSIMEKLEKYYLTIIHSKLRGEINNLNKTIDETNLDLDKLTKEKSYLQDVNNKKEEEIKALLVENNFLEKTIDEKDNQLEILREEIKVMDSIIAEKERTIDNMEN